MKAAGLRGPAAGVPAGIGTFNKQDDFSREKEGCETFLKSRPSLYLCSCIFVSRVTEAFLLRCREGSDVLAPGAEKKKRMRNKRGWLACVACLLVFAGIALWRQCDAPAALSYRHNEGLVFNTIYHFTYQSDEDYQSQIEEELRRFDASLSPFNSEREADLFVKAVASL